MNTIRATWKGGRIVPNEPADWPEGSDLLVEPLPAAGARIGLDESEWRDDPASRADWDAWIQTIEPLEFSPEEEARFADFDSQMGRYNVEAVRQQMEEKSLP